MIVTVSGWSGLTNAYRSELSATGSLLISGASRCEDMNHRPYGEESGTDAADTVQARLTTFSRWAASLASVRVTREPPENTSKVPFLASRSEITSGALSSAAGFSPARLNPGTLAAETPTTTEAAMVMTRRRDRRGTARVPWWTRLMLGLSSDARTGAGGPFRSGRSEGSRVENS